MAEGAVASQLSGRLQLDWNCLQPFLLSQGTGGAAPASRALPEALHLLLLAGLELPALLLG